MNTNNISILCSTSLSTASHLPPRQSSSRAKTLSWNGGSKGNAVCVSEPNLRESLEGNNTMPRNQQTQRLCWVIRNRGRGSRLCRRIRGSRATSLERMFLLSVSHRVYKIKENASWWKQWTSAYRKRPRGVEFTDRDGKLWVRDVELTCYLASGKRKQKNGVSWLVF